MTSSLSSTLPSHRCGSWAMFPGSHPASSGPVLGEELRQALNLVLVFHSNNREARPRPGFLRGEARTVSSDQ